MLNNSKCRKFWSMTKWRISAIFGLSVAYAVYFLYHGNAEMDTIPKASNRQGSIEINAESIREGYLKFRGKWINANYPEILDFIRNMTIGPSQEPYNLTIGNNYSALEFLMDQKGAPWVDVLAIAETLLPKKKPRYFLECGANNGELYANTLYLEKYRNWTGLLIEADPVYFAGMKTKHRKAVQVEACASPRNSASIMTFNHSPYSYQATSKKGNYTITNPGRGHLVGINNFNITDKTGWTKIDVLCVPLYQIMLASNMTNFDLVFLDAEGAELSILETIPFDKVDMKLILVEMVVEAHHKKIASLLRKNNFTLHAFYEGRAHPSNGLFIRNDIYDGKKLEKRRHLSEWYELLIGDKQVGEVSVGDQFGLLSIVEMTSENRNLTDSLLQKINSD